MSDERKPSIQFYKDQADEWRWRVYAANGEVISVSSEGYKNRLDAEQGAAITLVGITEAAVQALTVSKATDRLIRMKPVVEAIIRSSGMAIAIIAEMGYYNERGLTKKGSQLVREMEQHRHEVELEELEISKAIPEMKSALQIPVQYSDQPQVVAVRVK